MERVALAKFFGCSPSDTRNMNLGEIKAAHRLAAELEAASKKRR
jgi:hypothetical protein